MTINQRKVKLLYAQDASNTELIHRIARNRGDPVAYGFRRNALGIKPIGLTIALGCLLWVLGTEGVLSLSSTGFVSKAALLAMPETATATLIASAAMLAVWTVFFTNSSVRTAAFTYAEMLLRACDTL